MPSIMRARFTAQPVGYGHLVLFQTFWRPGTAGGSTADATDILARVRACLNAAASAFSANCVWSAITEVDCLEDLTGAITGAFTGSAPATVAGTAGGDNLNASLSTLIKANTNLIVGRRFLKGRTYLPGPTENIEDTAGRPSAVPATINAAFNGMLTGGSTASFPVVWHRPNPKGSSSGTSGPITGYQMQVNYFGVQRRRRF